MLKGLSPLLSADLLWVLKTMGHGEDLLVCDSNHPAGTIAKRTVSGRIIEMPGCDLPTAVKAILTVYPLDPFVEKPVTRMEVVGAPGEILPMMREVEALCSAAEGRTVPTAALERFAFYEAAAKAFAVVRTSEFRPYGCFLFKKGVIFPSGDFQN
jgi:L-fucose mutarotase